MKISMFNVDFGESIIISDCLERDNLLVDYGSEINTNIKYIKDDILCSIKAEGGNIAAMMTHFHDDHINGFIELARDGKSLFNKIYIPNIFSTYNSYDVNRITYVEIEVVLFFLLNYKFAKGKLALFEMLKAIMEIDAELYILKRGDIFNSANTEYITLWPNISEIKFMKYSTENELKKFLNMLGKELSDPLDLNYKINRISNLLSNTFLRGTESDARGEIERNINELNKDIEKLAEKAKELNEKGISKKRKDELNRWIKRLKLNANKVSIVFQNKLDRIGSNILMTGDIDKCRLKWILGNKLRERIAIHDRFNIIKAPHHGTKDHFIDNFPQTRNIIISNGKTNKSKRGKISSCYLRYQGRGAIINCTNTDRGRCEVLERGNTCQGRCNVLDKKEKIEIYYRDIEESLLYGCFIDESHELTDCKCSGKRVYYLECLICYNRSNLL